MYDDETFAELMYKVINIFQTTAAIKAKIDCAILYKMEPTFLLLKRIEILSGDKVAPLPGLNHSLTGYTEQSPFTFK